MEGNWGLEIIMQDFRRDMDDYTRLLEQGKRRGQRRKRLLEVAATTATLTLAAALGVLIFMAWSTGL